MTVTIQFTQKRTLEDGPLYRVDTEVIYVSGIAQEIFVFNTDTDEFEHVAVTYDMQQYPAGKTAALQEGSSFYREKQAIVDYSSQNTAVEAATYTRARIQLLAREYQTVNDEFIGENTYSYTGGN